MRSPLIALIVIVSGAAGVMAEAPTLTKAPEQNKTQSPWELEWAYLSKYRDANDKLGPPARGERRVVFLGDSITEGWGKVDAKFFKGKPYVNRGISGQTTSQMLVRFRQDVINLKPALVVILGGTNDIAENGGVTTLEAIEENLQSMVELARANGIRVVMSSVLPAKAYYWRPGIRPEEKIYDLNRWIASFCAKNRLVYINYYPQLADETRAMRPEFSSDGVHPNSAGYAVMEPLAERAIAVALR
jgi:lysophospholipase L1-like esterase